MADRRTPAQIVHALLRERARTEAVRAALVVPLYRWGGLETLESYYERLCVASAVELAACRL